MTRVLRGGTPPPFHPTTAWILVSLLAGFGFAAQDARSAATDESRASPAKAVLRVVDEQGAPVPDARVVRVIDRRASGPATDEGVIPIEVAELVEPPATSKPDLVRLLPDWNIEEASVNLVYPASGKTDPRVQSLIKIARANLQWR